MHFYLVFQKPCLKNGEDRKSVPSHIPYRHIITAAFIRLGIYKHYYNLIRPVVQLLHIILPCIPVFIIRNFIHFHQLT